MVNVLQSFLGDNSQIIARDKYSTDVKHDFLKEDIPVETTAIFTNPPFCDKHEFIKKAAESGLPTALLVPVETMNCKASRHLWKRGFIYLILPRVKFERNDLSTCCPVQVMWLFFNWGNELKGSNSGLFALKDKQTDEDETDVDDDDDEVSVLSSVNPSMEIENDKTKLLN